MGPKAGVDYNSPYLMVNSVVSYPPPLQRGRGGVGKISRTFVSAYFMPLSRHFIEHGIGQPHAWAGFNHHKMTMNLGPVEKLHKSPTQMGSLMLLTDTSTCEFLKKTKFFGFKNPYKNLQNKNTWIYS
jgi:hypothetical protein